MPSDYISKVLGLTLNKTLPRLVSEKILSDLIGCNFENLDKVSSLSPAELVYADRSMNINCAINLWHHEIRKPLILVSAADIFIAHTCWHFCAEHASLRTARKNQQVSKVRFRKWTGEHVAIWPGKTRVIGKYMYFIALMYQLVLVFLLAYF